MLKRWPKTTILLTIIVLLTAFFSIAEITLAYVAPHMKEAGFHSGEGIEHDPLLGWRNKSNFSDTFKNNEFSIQVTTNSAGMRDQEYSQSRSDQKRMLVLGDSFGWGWGVSQSEIFSEILEEELGWEVINTSVPGYGTDQQFLALKHKWKAYNPDIVVVLFFENDFINNHFNEQHGYNKPLLKVIDNQLTLTQEIIAPPRWTQNLHRYLMANTILVKEAMIGFSKLKKHFRQKRLTRKIRIQQATKIIEGMLRTTRSIGSELVVVSVPMKWNFVKGFKRHSKKLGYHYLPLNEAFKGDSSHLWLSDGHWNGEGHKIAAEAIYQFLLQEHLITIP